MILFAMALAAAGPLPDLDAAIRTYESLVVEAQRDGDTSWLPAAANVVCGIAYRYTLDGQGIAATDTIIAYRGPNADRLKLSCSLYFKVRS